MAIQLSGILDGEPTVESDLGEVWFRKTATGYMGYLPVTYNAEGGDHTLQLTCGTLQKEITLTVTRTLYDTVSVPAEEDVGGGEEFRNAIWPLYTTGSSAKLWNGRFEAPSAGAVSLAYGTTQMVDGQRSGQATGLTYAAADGDSAGVRGMLRAMDYIDRHLCEKLTLADIAAQAGCSPTYFSALFRRYNTVSLWEYITTRRVEQAVRRICAPDFSETMLSVALGCGFNSTASFNRAFRQCTGMTPSEYRHAGNILLH